MEKNYSCFKISWLLILLLLTSQVWAQQFTYLTVPAIGGATSNNGRGPMTFVNAHRSCAIYPAAEFAGLFAAGDTIFTAGYIITTPIATAQSGDIRILMVNTSDAGFLKNPLWDSVIASRGQMDTVYDGPITIPAVAGPYFVTLTKPFVYNGGGMYVAFEFTQPMSATTSAVYSCNNTIANSQRNVQGANLGILNSLVNVSNFRPQLYLGKKTPTNDAQIMEVYSLGKLPIPFATPYGVKARVKNLGLDTLLNKAFYLSVSPNNMISDSVIVDSLLPNQEKTISFVPYSSTNLGTDTVRVFCAPDNNNANNLRRYGQIVNLNTYNYADPFRGPIGGVGFNGGTGDFVAKFPYTGTNSVNQIGVNFNTGGTSLRVGIWDTSATGAPGALLWQSAPITTAAGLNTIPVNPPVPILGTFFVGVRQTSITNAAFSYQDETPIRGQTFYYTAPTGNTVWTDFLTTNSNFRFMIEPRLQLANDIGFISISKPCNAFPLGQNIAGSQATLYNYGSNSQFTLPVRMEIRNAANAVVFTDSTNISFILSNSEAIANFPGTFSPTVAGTYTMKAWASLSTDGDRNNDTITKTIVVAAPLPGVNPGTRLQFDGFDDLIEVKTNSAIVPVNNFTIEAWVRPSTAVGTAAIYSLDSTLNDTSLTFNLAGLTPQVVMKTTMGYLIASSNVNIVFNSWSHVALTYNGFNVKIYVNGQLGLDTTLNGNVVNKGGSIYLGRRAGLGTALNGGMDNYMYWNQVRTATQIRTDMHFKRPILSNPNLLQYLRFDEGGGSSILADMSGNCNIGIMNNFDFNNITATPAWFISSLPLDTTIGVMQTINSTTNTAFANKSISLNFQNMSGSNEVVAHYFREPAIGFQPDTILTSGSKTRLGSYWILYNYGTASYDSVLATFTVPAGNLGNTALDSIYLANRESGASGLWNLARNPADTINLSNQSVRFWLPRLNTFAKQYGIASNTTSNPLPVKYAWFKGSIVGQDAILNWATASEINNSHFVIERSTDGIFFMPIGKIEGVGSAQTLHQYKFMDENALELGASKLYYRLLQVDIDGKESISEIVILTADNEPLVVKSIQPNPFSQNLSIVLDNIQDLSVQIQLMDMSGKSVMHKNLGLESGSHLLNLDEAGNLPGGIYFLRLDYLGKSETYKLVKLKE